MTYSLAEIRNGTGFDRNARFEQVDAQGYGRQRLSLTEAGYLADLIRAVEAGAKIEWYPVGASGDAPHGDYSLRCFAHEGGGLWFDKDGDVRDACVHFSGIGELWLKVSDVIRALANALDGIHGLDQPMAIIRYPAPSVRDAEVVAAMKVLDDALESYIADREIEIRDVSRTMLQAAAKARA